MAANRGLGHPMLLTMGDEGDEGDDGLVGRKGEGNIESLHIAP